MCCALPELCEFGRSIVGLANPPEGSVARAAGLHRRRGDLPVACTIVLLEECRGARLAVDPNLGMTLAAKVISDISMSIAVGDQIRQLELHHVSHGDAQSHGFPASPPSSGSASKARSRRR